MDTNFPCEMHKIPLIGRNGIGDEVSDDRQSCFQRLGVISNDGDFEGVIVVLSVRAKMIQTAPM